jgi:P27 family predicted phage terminase small subunit
VSEPNPTTNRPSPPTDLTGVARERWEWVCDQLAQIGTLSNADHDLICLYARTFAIYDDASRQLQENGVLFKQPNGWIGEHPSYKVVRETSNMLSKLSDQLGLSARTRKPKDDQMEFRF